MFAPSQGAGRSPVALVTGATAGIGAAFATQLAREGSDLVLVARTASRLTQQASELMHGYGVGVETISADLSTSEGLGRVEARVADATAPIDVLVNNAGFGLDDTFLNSDISDEDAMLAVNVRAVMRLTHAALPIMVGRGSGGIVNVSSIAGFVPTATGASYSATKAWVIAFSESLSVLVKDKGVQITALCPGFTRTEFHDRAGVVRSEVPERMWLDAPDVVATGLRDHRRGAVISVPGVPYKLTVLGSRVVPRRVLRWASARVTAGASSPTRGR